MVIFRVGPEDAAILIGELQPVFDTLDLLNLPNQSIYLKLMIDGAPSKPFSANTMARFVPSKTSGARYDGLAETFCIGPPGSRRRRWI